MVTRRKGLLIWDDTPNVKGCSPLPGVLPKVLLETANKYLLNGKDLHPGVFVGRKVHCVP